MIEGKDLFEAFRALEELNEDLFDLNSTEDVNELSDVVSKDAEDGLEDIIDPLATTDEELQDSYVGKVILDCAVCQSKLYKDAAEVVINEEEGLANIGEECPFCQSADGYKIIGEVAPYSETEVDVEVTPKEDGSEEATIDIDTTGEKGMKAAEAAMDEFTKDKDDLSESVEESDNQKAKVESPKTKKEKESTDKANYYYRRMQAALDDPDFDEKEFKKNYYSESINNINIDTDKETISVTATEKEEEGEEMIAPITDETKEKFQEETPDYVDIDIDEFDEENFDNLGENYLRRVYENVASYKTTQGKVNGNTLKLEGIITFKSGKKAKTNFIFEAKTINKNGKLKFFGENKQFAKGSKSFALTAKVNKNKLIAESLTYNYRAKDSKNNKSKRIYGTVRN